MFTVHPPHQHARGQTNSQGVSTSKPGSCISLIKDRANIVFGKIFQLRMYSIMLLYCFLVVTDFETQNKYRVYNSMGQQVFFIQEGNQSILILNQNSQKELSLLMLQWINLWLCSESGCCWRYCCGPDRKFMMHITDNNNQVRRPVLCCKRHNRWLFGLFRDDAHTVFFCTTGSDAITATVWVRGTVLCRLLRLL